MSKDKNIEIIMKNKRAAVRAFEMRIGGYIMLDRIALILTIIGALNWGSIGLFRFDIVAWIFGGQDALVSRIVYTVVALAGIWCISLLFRERDREEITGDVR